MNNSQKPSFSVVIPTLNSAKTLQLAMDRLDSPLVHEVIVVDNGSTDETVAVSRVRGAKVLEAPHASIATLRNLGARQAAASYPLFLDSDAILPQSYFEIAAELFQDSSAIAVGCNEEGMPDNVTWVPRVWNMHLGSHSPDGESEWLATLALAVRRSDFEAVGGFWED
jgi:glycosyltransferase involved in cell wall biosynthesis